jgi:hypothetical protein
LRDLQHLVGYFDGSGRLGKIKSSGGKDVPASWLEVFVSLSDSVAHRVQAPKFLTRQFFDSGASLVERFRRRLARRQLAKNCFCFR